MTPPVTKIACGCGGCQRAEYSLVLGEAELWARLRDRGWTEIGGVRVSMHHACRRRLRERLDVEAMQRQQQARSLEA